MSPLASATTRSHAGAGVPRSLRASSRRDGPSFFGPGVRSEKRGPVIYGSYVDELLAILPASGVVGDRKFVHSNHLYSVAALTKKPPRTLKTSTRKTARNGRDS
jgi:hypothetical protein